MKYKLITTKDYLLLIDEEAEIKLFNYIFNSKENLVEKIESKVDWIFVLEENKEFKTFSKVIAYYPLTKESQELDLPLLPNPFEFDIEKLADKMGFYDSSEDNKGNFTTKAFITGYKSAQSKQFTLEDIKKAIEMSRETEEPNGFTELKYSEEEIIKFLTNEQLPKEFIPEYEDYEVLGERDDDGYPLWVKSLKNNNKFRR